MSFSSQTIKPLQFNNIHYSLNFLIRLFEQKLKIFQQPQNKSPRKTPHYNQPANHPSQTIHLETRQLASFPTQVG